nr:hypothetical transcript [Hymenolepis microstoma]
MVNIHLLMCAFHHNLFKNSLSRLSYFNVKSTATGCGQTGDYEIRQVSSSQRLVGDRNRYQVHILHENTAFFRPQRDDKAVLMTHHHLSRPDKVIDSPFFYNGLVPFAFKSSHFPQLGHS